MKKTIIFSLFLSILHSILFWEKDLGISVVLFTITLILFLVYVLNKNKKIENPKAILWSIPIFLLSSTYFIFNSAIFNVLNTIAIFALIAVMSVELTKTKLEIKEFCLKILLVVFGPFESMSEVIDNIKQDIVPKERADDKYDKLKKIGKSLLIALPIVIVVLWLLISADSVFGSLFTGIANYINSIFENNDIGIVLARVLVIAFLFIYISSYIFNLVKDNTAYTKDADGIKSKVKIESYTINTILVILNVIYLVFSIIQFKYLFVEVAGWDSLDFSEYARQGFFQLMFVSFINFAIIFFASINKTEVTNKQKSKTEILEILTLIFTAIILISAYVRMFMYEQACGYTHLRLLVYFVLITEFLSIIPIILYLMGKKINLCKSILVIITVMYVGLNYINIDKLIAKNNVDRYLSSSDPEKKIDLTYLKNSTDTDAIPEIKRLLTSEDAQIVQNVETYIYEMKLDYSQKHYDWQEFNISKQIFNKK